MTIDAPEDDSTGPGRTPPRGVARRSALSVAWTAPVIAAAVAAPGAAASPAPVEDGTFVGVWLTALAEESPRRFRVDVYLNGTGEPGAPVVLSQDAAVSIHSYDHDVVAWGEAITTDDARSGTIHIPAGVYPTTSSYTIRDRSVVVTGPVQRGSTVTDLTAEPAGRFVVEGIVTRGPVYPYGDIYSTGTFGRTRLSVVLRF